MIKDIWSQIGHIKHALEKCKISNIASNLCKIANSVYIALQDYELILKNLPSGEPMLFNVLYIKQWL